MTNTKAKIGIVGLGLIGGSIEKCLTNTCKYEILTVSASQGRQHKLEDLKDCDLVFLCGPQGVIYKQLEEIASLQAQPESEFFQNTIITDVGSTKQKICERAEELGLKNFVGGHPMAGTEEQGYDASFPELFGGCTWVLTEQSARTRLLEELIIIDLGAGNIEIIDPVTHDKAVAAISHVPLVLSIGLGNLLSEVPQAKKFIGPGFKGMARLAKGNQTLGKEIITANRGNIKEVWKIYRNYVDSFLDIAGDNLIEEIEEVKTVLQ